MSSSLPITSILAYASRQINIYVGSITFAAGTIGGLLNIITFLSLKTFRQKSSAFYLIVMSFFNIADMVVALLSRILISGFNIDWTLSSSIYCKSRFYVLQFCYQTSFSCICLAAIDQYFSTCPYPRLRHWSNIKTARHLTIILIIVWLLHGIPFLVYYDIVESPVTGARSCTITNQSFQKYVTYCYVIILTCVLPLLISGSFGLAAYHNIQDLVHQTIPIVQRYSEKQLTKMVLNQLLFNFIFTSPYTVVTILIALMASIKDPELQAKLAFANSISILVFYFSFACSFYVYVGSSERFRKQLKYVLVEIHLKRWRQNLVAINQVAPQSQHSSY